MVVKFSTGKTESRLTLSLSQKKTLKMDNWKHFHGDETVKGILQGGISTNEKRGKSDEKKISPSRG